MGGSGGSGDRTEHLYWRIMNGEGPRDFRPRVAVVLIGTNDLTAAATVSLLHILPALHGATQSDLTCVSASSSIKPATDA